MIDKLLQGETIIYKSKGSSMSPVIKSRQPVRIKPTDWYACNIDDIVLCKVRGRIYLHFVKGKNLEHGLQIMNNRGHVNGWTKIVYGKVVEII